MTSKRQTSKICGFFSVIVTFLIFFTFALLMFTIMIFDISYMIWKITKNKQKKKLTRQLYSEHLKITPEALSFSMCSRMNDVQTSFIVVTFSTSPNIFDAKKHTHTHFSFPTVINGTIFQPLFGFVYRHTRGGISTCGTRNFKFQTNKTKRHVF